MLLLDKPSTETSQESDDIKYCHTLCMRCNDNITLCGAYKPVRCNVLVIYVLGMNTCPVCKKQMCPDCEDLLHEGCPRCGR